jgi:hypothetical protein
MKLLRDLGLAPQAPNPEMEAPEATEGRPLMPCCTEEHACEMEKANGCC